MFIRCVVRVIEGFELGACTPPDGNSAPVYCGPVHTHEWFLWVFEVANIAIFVAALAVFTPGKYLSKDDRRFLDPLDGVTEREGPGFAQVDNRPFIVTVCDPFNFAALFNDKSSLNQFWKEDWPVAEGRSYAEAKGST